jgi:Dyp-type peroxidase family
MPTVAATGLARLEVSGVPSHAGEAGVDLSNVQGNIVPGFNKDYQAFVLVAFPSRSAARLWVRTIRSEIASAADVFAFKEAYKVVSRLQAANRRAAITARWVNLALSWRGLEVLLGSAEVTSMPSVFHTNQVPFCNGPAGGLVHAWLQLAADCAADLDAELARQRATFECCGVRELRVFRGHALEGQVEHFGFKDGVSSIAIEGVPRSASSNGASPTEAPLAAGEFFFGERDGLGRRTLPGPEWTRGGTFVAFMQLEQDVRAFRAAIESSAARLRLPYAQMAARLVGRSEDGTEVRPSPRLSHIARARPQWVAGVARHRIIRRGIPYGEPLARADAQDGAADRHDGERGLLFVAYQADLVRQFEQVWRVWLNGADFPGPGGQRDGLVGQPIGAAEEPRPVAVSRGAPPAGIDQLRMPRFVKPHYGGYFMAPSLTALAHLGGA